uniref:Sushi domain-containing protein n=1 Tax=Molossus molossus TaxID=27622 RepID=A0A7J8BLY0_MOLMO|nr:hypothetical protein HJG59_010136 [Molossus molossus]
MLLLVSALLSAWVSWAHGQESCAVPVFGNATAIITGKPFRPSDTLDYQCLDGHENKREQHGSRVCGEDTWSPLPTCLRRIQEDHQGTIQRRVNIFTDMWYVKAVREMLRLE